MATLRNGKEVADIRLDRLPQFDERSRKYGIREVITKQPRSYTWRCLQVLDQGNEGSCVGHGVAHELIARPSEVHGIDHQYAREKIYWEAQKIDEWQGGSYPGARPFYEGTSVLAGVKVSKSLGWMHEYRWGFSLDDLILGVGRNGPAVLGINWYSEMYDVDNDGFIHSEGSIDGGHCILCNAVNIKYGYFTLHNSWGPEWGIDGEAKISFEDMEQLLHEDGEQCFFVGRHTKAVKV